MLVLIEILFAGWALYTLFSVFIAIRRILLSVLALSFDAFPELGEKPVSPCDGTIVNTSFFENSLRLCSMAVFDLGPKSSGVERRYEDGDGRSFCEPV